MLITEPQFIFPFGTSILIDKIPDNVFASIEELVAKIKPQLSDSEFINKNSHSRSLVGKNSYQIVVPEDMLIDSNFSEYVLNLSNKYASKYDLKLNNPYIASAWLNFSRAGDYNSIHVHDNLFSGIIYVYQDEAISKEISNHPISTKWSSTPGTTTFLYDINNRNQFNYWAYLKDFVKQEVVLFPSWLMHYVNPFTSSDAERITLAFNIDITN
jgi:uncharacterized protein (TIGR02466 family)